jgi:S1-C subfamily serine protease
MAHRSDTALWPWLRAAAVGAGVIVLTSCATPAREKTASVPAAFVPACLQPDMDTRESVVRISTDAGAHGSGVVIGPNRVLTAAHVVYDAHSTKVGRDGDDYVPARVLGLDSDNDLALLEADTAGLAPVPIARAPLAAYEDVWAIGYPMALDMAVSQGRFERVANGKVYTSAWITSGVSGGGLLRCNGGSYELAGIVRDYVAYLRGDDYVNASQSTSAPAESIRAFLARLEGQHSGTLTARPPSEVSL